MTGFRDTEPWPPVVQGGQNVLPVLGVLWFVAGLSLAFREVSSEAVAAGTCQPPVWAQAVMGLLVVAMSGIAIWRSERWPSRRWFGVLAVLAVAFLVMFAGIAPRLDTVCVN